MIMTNNFAFDPVQMQNTLNSLPPKWIPYANAALVLLMVLGRVVTAPSVLTSIKSVFLGSVHSATTSSVAAQSVGKPITVAPVVVAKPVFTPAQIAAITDIMAAPPAVPPVSGVK
jgi:hypothetical protein